MNRIYKVIYSKARQCYIVVSELAKRNHKSSQPSIDHSTPALARIIAVTELIKAGEAYMKSAGIIWPLFYTAVFYLAFVGILTLLFNYIERKLSYFR